MADMINHNAINEIEEKINDELQHLDACYLQIGKLYCLKNEDNQDEMIRLCQEVDVINEHINQFKQEILALKGIVICPNCNHENPDSAVFCLKCGTKLIKTVDDGQHCVNCGAELMDGQLYCTRCGTKVVHEEAENDSQDISADIETDEELKMSTIRQCPYCGHEIEENQLFCTYCGKSLEEDDQSDQKPAQQENLLCPHCQSPIKPGQKFCVICGNKLELSSQDSHDSNHVKVCPNCGLEVDGSKDKCDICGTSLNETVKENVCPKCGKPYQPGQSFCTGCGTKLS